MPDNSMISAFARLPPALREVVERYQRPHHRTTSVNLESDSARQHLLDPSEKHEDDQSLQRRDNLLESTWKQLRFSTRALSTIVAVILACVLLGFLTVHRIQPSATIPIREEPQFLYVAIPHAKTPDIAMCRTILSAQILNYPVPTWIQWDEEEFNQDQPYHVQHYRTRLRATADWINGLPHSSDSSLVILLDEQASWFQLRPEVLLKRYYAAMKDANERLRPQGVNQTILFAAQRECSTDPENNDACVSGQTSLAIPAEHRGPRFLNSAVLIGPVKDVRTLLARAAQKYNNWPGSLPQQLFASIYTEQQFSRYNPSSNNRDYELRIGVDYQSLISYSTTDTPHLANFSASPSLPTDILDSMAPFWTVSGAEPTLPHNATWNSVPLLHHPSLPPHNTPALIHHQASPAADNRPYAEEWWADVWFGPHARWLYTAMIHLPASVVASVVDNGGVRQVFWHPTYQHDKAGVRLAKDRGWVHFNDICKPEVVGDAFGDGGAAWLGSIGW